MRRNYKLIQTLAMIKPECVFIICVSRKVLVSCLKMNSYCKLFNCNVSFNSTITCSFLGNIQLQIRFYNAISNERFYKPLIDHFLFCLTTVVSMVTQQNSPMSYMSNSKISFEPLKLRIRIYTCFQCKVNSVRARLLSFFLYVVKDDS